MSTTLVERASTFLGSHLSRRSFINRSAMAASAVAVGSGVDLLLKPGTAYGAICTCGSSACGCGSTCCAGFSEFCCSINGGYNYCPTDTIMGGWWRADNSSFCGGPRYYMDCHALCGCTTGCGGGWGFCDTSCDGVNCGCGPDGCNSWVTGCFQFRYGQCNQQIDCIGRIVCRVVACVPPWTVDPTCTTTLAVDNSTAEMTAACWTSAPPSPPPPPPPPCFSPQTQCMATGLAASADAGGYARGHVVREGPPLRRLPLAGRRVHRAPGRAGRRHGRHRDRARLLAGRRRRRHLRLRRRRATTAPWAGARWSRPSWAWPPPPPATATGSSPPTAASSPSATPASTARWAAWPSTGRWWAWPRRRPATGTGWWRPTAASSPSATPASTAPWAGWPSTPPSWAWGPRPPVTGTGWWPPTAASSPSATPPSTGPWAASTLQRPVVGMASAAAGYWMVAADGGIFSFDVAFYGSPA